MSESSATAGRLTGVRTSRCLPRSTVFAYGLPGIGAGYMYLLIGLYVMKFSTAVLLISPLVMGLIFSASRIWDAVSDPLVGYLSDRTRSRYGRRRTWMAASVIPIAGAFVMIFAPPTALSDTGLVIWMAGGRHHRLVLHDDGVLRAALCRSAPNSRPTTTSAAACSAIGTASTPWDRSSAS